MGTKLTNNATGRLAVSLTAASTQLSMVVGDAVKFPTIAEGSGDNFPLTAVKANGELEIMLCTLTNGNVFTVQRGQEGTSPKGFSAGDRIELRLTAGTIDGMIDDRIDAAIEVVLEDLGTAAYKNVGIDTGNVMEVGAFGLGVVGQAPRIDDLNSVMTTGFYRADSGTLNQPAGSTFGTVLVKAWDASTKNIVQEYTGVGNNNDSRFFYRSFNVVSNTWHAWREIYHTGNFPPIGFVYTQFPGEAAPSALFGGTWALIFNTEGIAFRTEGGNASSFGGGIQQDAYGSHSHSASSNSTGAHTHNTSGTAASAGGHSHTASTNSAGSHSHSGTASSAGAHRHSMNTNGGATKSGGNPAGGSSTGGFLFNNAVNSEGAHTHSLSIDSAGGHSHTVSVDNGGAHTHSVSGTAASAGAHSHTITVSASGSKETRMINRTIRVWKRTA